MNILIVDDHEDNIYLLESLLKGNGYNVKKARNGAEALNILEKGETDLIISDILMPVMDGFQLLRKVKTGENMKHIPFIIYTATYTSAQDEEFALKIGADRFIEKPCEPDVFIKEIRSLADEYKTHGGDTARPLVQEEEALKLYSERLVKKLEQKVLEVERQMKERQSAEEERERLRIQLAHAQKMESVGRLAGGVAHDFNNILQSMMGYSEMLLNELEEGGQAQEFALEIMECIKRASSLTRQLLAFARKQAVVPHIVDLNEIVEGMLKMLRRLISEDIDIVWLPKTGIWPLKMDHSQIEQVIANLCVNASDAIEGVGMLTIETGMVRMDSESCAKCSGCNPGEYVVLSVSDDGCGMDKKTLEMLFEPFYTTKDAGKGTGLGLATVYGIVKQNRGFIEVKSEQGKGSIFRVFFPRHDGKPVETIEPLKEEMALGKGETILLVEDEQEILKISRAILEQLGYRVFTAGSAGEAIKLSRDYSGRIDLLITDVVMPEMNGKELGRKMRELFPGIRILYMSGYSDDIVSGQSAEGESEPFIQKPFTIKRISKKIRQVLDGV